MIKPTGDLIDTSRWVEVSLEDAPP